MKRKSTAASTTPVKRVRLHRGPGDLGRSRSIREQAEPYHLGTARFRVEALTSTWSLGSNRQIHGNHVQSLCRIFEEQGLQREPVENHLLVACTRAEVERMAAHQEQAGHETSESKGIPPSWPSFDDWMSVNGSHVEIMAGQHRVEALKLYLRRIGISTGQPERYAFEKDNSWWICDMYDKDRLPAHLSVKLRANRQGSILPDSHGQVWMELATLAAADSSLFRGTNAQVQDEMLRALGLSGRVPFPLRRLMTLWKNRSWQPMITRWCSTDIGRETFNVSLWEEMARHRIDDFWFDIFETVLESISKLKVDESCSMILDDWNTLARLLPPPLVRNAQAVFYPGAPHAVPINFEDNGQFYRRPKFFSALDDATYHRTYQVLLENPNLYFPDIQTLFRTGRQLGKILSQLMIHVGQWLNLNPKHVSERDNNKPQLWLDLLPASSDGDDDDDDEPTEHRAAALALARHLQRHIFATARPHIPDFTAPNPAAAYLALLPATTPIAYAERFALPAWSALLVAVHRVAGSRLFLRPALVAAFHRLNAATAPCSPSPSLSLSVSESAAEPLAHVLRDALARLPLIAHSPALSSEVALRALVARIAPVVADWAALQLSSGEAPSRMERRGDAAVATTAAAAVRLVDDSVARERGGFPLVAARSGLGAEQSLPYEPLSFSSSSSLIQSGIQSTDIKATEDCQDAMELQLNVSPTCGLEDKPEYDVGRASLLKILNA